MPLHSPSTIPAPSILPPIHPLTHSLTHNPGLAWPPPLPSCSLPFLLARPAVVRLACPIFSISSGPPPHILLVFRFLLSFSLSILDVFCSFIVSIKIFCLILLLSHRVASERSWFDLLIVFLSSFSSSPALSFPPLPPFPRPSPLDVDTVPFSSSSYPFYTSHSNIAKWHNSAAEEVVPATRPPTTRHDRTNTLSRAMASTAKSSPPTSVATWATMLLSALAHTPM